ncbi:DNA-processing protein DprA [bacterium AH-315-P15]|nr:DNA-processing protein DprA [bacterium AH-315-P15]
MPFMREWRPPKNSTEKLTWLRLFRSENVGPATFFALMGRYDSPEAALGALPGLAARGGLRRNIKLAPADDVEREFEATQNEGADFLFLGEDAFPPLLAAIDQGPPIIAMRGNPELLAKPTLGMVGARNASAAGRKIARTLSCELGERGFVVASGLARGIDTAAHEGALKTGTIAIMAGGADHVYPSQNQALYERILETGCIISEMPWGMPPQARHFPRRNRIISGLSAGVLVVEAAARSGSLITARYALEQNREVFAVPGSPLDPRAEGSNKLIQDGARLIMSVDDVLDGLEQFPIAPSGPSPPPAPPLRFDEPEELPQGLRDQVAGLLGGAPIGLDDLVREVGEPVGLISGVLLELELAGKIERQAGPSFRRLD